MLLSVVGIDPGPTTGLCFLDFQQTTESKWVLTEKLIMQVHGGNVAKALEAILMRWYGATVPIAGRFAQVERFVTGNSAGTKGADAEVTRRLVMALAECMMVGGYKTQIRSAADVKPWATDKRLIRASLAKEGEIHGKLRDGFDAARHALFCAVNDARIPDPLA